jgi:hypothetical protein
MRIRRIVSALCLYPSDTLREHARRAGIEGLRHKLRHKTVSLPGDLSARLSRGHPGVGGLVHVPGRAQKKINKKTGPVSPGSDLLHSGQWVNECNRLLTEVKRRN